jgi:hypothetical protein
MNSISKQISELRLLVGYLGEKSQFNWWSSDFLGATSPAFLTPIFNRTSFLAQYRGVIAAAAKIHDEAIGIGNTFHLFRFPIGLEQSAAETLNDEVFVQSLRDKLLNSELALARLDELSKKPGAPSPGAVSVGVMSQELASELQLAAGYYFSAFASGIQTFPFVREA